MVRPRRISAKPKAIHERFRPGSATLPDDGDCYAGVLESSDGVCRKTRTRGRLPEGDGNVAGVLDGTSQPMGTVEKDEYDRLRRITDEDRMKAEHARLEMERHVARSPTLRSSVKILFRNSLRSL